MNQAVYIKGQRFNLSPSQAIGKGGEADIYKLGPDAALKLFKQPDHPDLAMSPQEQKGAQLRIQEHQKKLPAFPKDLPYVVWPHTLAYYPKNGLIVGYVMELIKDAEVLLRYRETSFRSNGVLDEEVVAIFQILHNAVRQIHQRQVVLGDFNDLNVLVRKDAQQQRHQLFLIDSDSFQFGPFPCRTFTETFVDPLHCDPTASSPIMNQKHDEMSDWYAFNVMLMQTLLCLARGPYGGVYRPKDKNKKVSDRQRPLKRITVFNPEVRYPKPARPLNSLPDTLLDHFESVFEKDLRVEFPYNLFNDLRWTTCTKCGKSHARSICPFCQIAPSHAVSYVSTSKVEANQIFETTGKIVHAKTEGGNLRLLYHYPKNNFFIREKGCDGPSEQMDLSPNLHYAISRTKTAIIDKNYACIFDAGAKVNGFSVDTFRGIPAIGANSLSFYFILGGVLKKTDNFHTTFFEDIGNVLAGQSIFWVGDEWGFGFYLAGNISQCFIFSATRKGINDGLTLKPFKGKLLDARCYFDKDKIWFFISNQVGGQTVNSCYLLNSSGVEQAYAEDLADSGGWLGSIKGHVAVGGALLAPTDDGIVRVKASGGSLAVDKEFPETAKFVHSGKKLLVEKKGLLSVGSRTIWRLILK